MINYFYQSLDGCIYFGIPKIANYAKCGDTCVVEFMFSNIYIRIGGSWEFRAFGKVLAKSYSKKFEFLND